jgi:YspA, cpYpsA-related SLOG family
MKVLVTGSREWTNEEIIRSELSRLPVGTIIVHGACPWGADTIADRIAVSLGFEVRRYPARWTARMQGHAGTARNQRMIDQEHFEEEPIDLCLAFLKNRIQWGGTMDCATLAREAGIEVKELLQ